MIQAQLEIACFNKISALLASEHGADRIELCRDKSVGGLTPEYEMVQEVCDIVTSEIAVMIRPRAGFCLLGSRISANERCNYCI